MSRVASAPFLCSPGKGNREYANSRLPHQSLHQDVCLKATNPETEHSNVPKAMSHPGRKDGGHSMCKKKDMHRSQRKKSDFAQEPASSRLTTTVRRPSMDGDFLQFNVAALMSAQENNENTSDHGSASKSRTRVSARHKSNVDDDGRVSGERPSLLYKTGGKGHHSKADPSLRRRPLFRRNSTGFGLAEDCSGLKKTMSFRVKGTIDTNEARHPKTSVVGCNDDTSDFNSTEESSVDMKKGKKSGGRGLIQNSRALLSRFKSRRKLNQAKSAREMDPPPPLTCLVKEPSSRFNFESDEEDAAPQKSNHRRGGGFAMLG